TGIADQAMRIDRVRRALHRVEVEFDALLAAGIDDRVVATPAAVVPELGAQVVGAVHALARHVGVELEGPPADLERACARRQFRQRALETPLADEAPRADGVGNDIDSHAEDLRARNPARQGRASAQARALRPRAFRKTADRRCAAPALRWSGSGSPA